MKSDANGVCVVCDDCIELEEAESGLKDTVVQAFLTVSGEWAARPLTIGAQQFLTAVDADTVPMQSGASQPLLIGVLLSSLHCTLLHCYRSDCVRCDAVVV